MQMIKMLVKMPIDVTKDDVLVSRGKAGDSHAFIELWDRHKNRLFHSARQILKSPEDAEEAVQEAFIKAYLHLHSFDGRSQFSTWMTRILINTALMMLRKKRGRVEISLSSSSGDQEGSDWELPDRTQDIESRYLGIERGKRLTKAIRRLPPTLRTVIEIQLTREVPVSDIARSVGISVPAAKSRLLRARAALRDSLQVSREF
jgi:RNA polymerase sigma-70 factor (ECF subfamily)